MTYLRRSQHQRMQHWPGNINMKTQNSPLDRLTLRFVETGMTFLTKTFIQQRFVFNMMKHTLHICFEITLPEISLVHRFTWCSPRVGWKQMTTLYVTHASNL